MKIIKLALAVTVLLPLVSCENLRPRSSGGSNDPLRPEYSERAERVLTKEMQDKLTPHEVLERLKSGNRRFVAADTVPRDLSKQVRKAVKGQFPKAIILSCVDSRVPVEDVFDQGIGDIFVARVAGNFVNADILGSMEYAAQVAGVKLVLVMGHEHCGAVKSTIDGIRGEAAGNMVSLAQNIQPAIDAVEDFPGARSSKNPEFVHKVCRSNVERTIHQIRERSAILAGLEGQGRVRVVGAIYDMDTGIVSFME